MVREGYKQTEIGVIPEDWTVQSLAQVASLDVGYAFKSSWYQKDTGIPLLRGENVGYGSPDWSDTRRLPEQNAKSFSPYLLHPGDIVIGMDRTFTKSGIKISLLRKGDCPCLLVQRVGRFVPLACSASFLWALLSSSKFQSSLQLEQKGMDIPHLSRSEILQPYVALPPTSLEQEAIAQTLSDVDALIAALDKLIAKQRHLKTGTMQQLLTGKKRLPGFCGEWHLINVNQHANLKARIGWQALTTAEYLDNGSFFLVTGTDFQNGTVNWSTCHFISEWRYSQDKNIQLHEGDVLLTKDGTIGKVGYVENMTKPAALNSGVFVIRPINESFHPRFLYYILNSEIFDGFLKRIFAGSTISHLYQKDFVTFEFLAPDLEEQRAIATVLSDMDAAISALETRRTKTQAIKQGMMQQLLTGRVRLEAPPSPLGTLAG